jgi:hypothetical protein
LTDRSAARVDRATSIAVALVLVALGFLPWCNWLPGGEEDPLYAKRFVEWGYGTGICVGIAVVAAVLLGKRVSLAGDSARQQTAAPNGASLDRYFDAMLFAGALALYSLIALFVFSGRPLMIDEVVQALQARIFAAGKLWVPVAEHREFFSVLHVVDLAAKRYSQFPPGGPALLAIGELVHAPWIVGPMCGAIAALLFARVVRFADPDGTRVFHRGAAVLFVVAPFGAYMFGSYMNHGPGLMWLLLSVVGLAGVTCARSDAPPRTLIGWAAVNGFGLGMAATIRPLDAFAFALPAAVWLLHRAYRDPRNWAHVVASGVGVAVPFAAMMWVNTQTTGSPLLFGYEVLWGAGHGLGFHTSPWGVAHTPARGIELLSLYVTRLQSYLFETPFPAMLPAIGAFALTRRLSAIDRYLIVSAVLLGGFYFAYWHDGFYLGPRFVLPWLPVLVLFSARLPRVIRERFGAGRVMIGTNAALIAGAAMAVVFSLPVRTAQYRGGLSSMRLDYTQMAAAAGVHNALVFVRESWGAEIIARMWAQGVSRNATETFYRKTDACVLDRAMRAIERDGVTGAAAEARLAPLMADSSRLIKSTLSTDPTEKLLPGSRYDAECVARINDDREGFALMVPLLLEHGSGNVYARDLQARDSLLLREYPARPVYQLIRRGSDVDAPFEWRPLRRDSLQAVWRSGTP